MDEVRAAIQTMLDHHGDGWSVSHFVVAMGLERLDEDGHPVGSAWLYIPAGQPDWITDGLLIAAEQLRESSDIE